MAQWTPQGTSRTVLAHEQDGGIGWDVARAGVRCLLLWVWRHGRADCHGACEGHRRGTPEGDDNHRGTNDDDSCAYGDSCAYDDSEANDDDSEANDDDSEANDDDRKANDDDGGGIRRELHAWL